MPPTHALPQSPRRGIVSPAVIDRITPAEGPHASDLRPDFCEAREGASNPRRVVDHERQRQRRASYLRLLGHVIDCDHASGGASRLRHVIDVLRSPSMGIVPATVPPSSRTVGRSAVIRDHREKACVGASCPRRMGTAHAPAQGLRACDEVQPVWLMPAQGLCVCDKPWTFVGAASDAERPRRHASMVGRRISRGVSCLNPCRRSVATVTASA